MVCFVSVIKKFSDKGEKTGWSYIEIDVEKAAILKKDVKVSFTVKGFLDAAPIHGVSLLPMGNGSFILALKTELRKKLRKNAGATVDVKLEADDAPYQLNREFLSCLHDSPSAAAYFQSLPLSHQKYFCKWIEGAKGEETRVRRIALALAAMECRLTFAEMIRSNKKADF